MTDVQRKQPAFIEFSHSLYLHPIAIFRRETNLGTNAETLIIEITYNECYVNKNEEILCQKYFQIKISIFLSFRRAKKSWTKI